MTEARTRLTYKTTIIATPDFLDGAGTNHIVQVYNGTEAGQGTSCPTGYNLVTRDHSSGSFSYTDVAIHFIIP